MPTATTTRAPAPQRPRIAEDVIQAELVRWCRSHADARLHRIFHIPNGGQRDGRSGGLMVALGVRRGIPDLFLPHMTTRQVAGMAVPVGGLWLEMKAADGVTSPQQKTWLAYFDAAGYATAVAYSLEEAQAALCGYLGIPTRGNAGADTGD
jgi:hypothetical protein